MCFRPAATTAGARICLGCHSVVDDAESTVCPYCGADLPAPMSMGAAPGTQVSPPSAPTPKGDAE